MSDEQLILQVWNKGRVIPSYDAKVWRHDAFGNVIKFEEYGRTTQYGWEIDHIKPVAKGGTDDLANLRPLQWEANRQKSDNY